jgi:hydroxyacylglutathione hydrolase
MLEDDFTYVIRKALKGHNLAPAEAARLAGIAENDVLAFTRGRFSAEIARQLAAVLQLNATALANHPNYAPHPLVLTGVHRLELPYREEHVNAWRISTPTAELLFDTGFGVGDCQKALGSWLPQQIFITHGHEDHVGGMVDFLACGIVHSGAKIAGAALLSPGVSLEYGSLTLNVCDLSGHANPALGYLIEGLEKPVLVTGDALFAGSMGGCGTPQMYQHALRQLRETLGPLDGETILLPGHGPATTLGEERRGNPFL